jgi:adenylate kinase
MSSQTRKNLRMVLLGPPASGKGTQGRLITERWGVPVVSVGEILRRETAAGTALGLEAGRYTKEGRLVPDRVAMQAIEGWLAQNEASFVIDGFPRSVGQAEALDEILTRRKMPLTLAVWLELDDESIRERVSKRVVCRQCGGTFRVGWQVEDVRASCPICGSVLEARHDDDPQTLTRRMTEYRECTEPVTRFYESLELLRRIDAGPTPEAVFARIETALKDVEVEAAA